MKIDKQLQIAKSFSNFFEESILDINLEKKEYEILKQGIFSSDMDDKWNVFIIENFLYLSRSWTDNCIYKIEFTENATDINLGKVKVTRDEKQYKGEDIQEDIIILKKLLQIYLKKK